MILTGKIKAVALATAFILMMAAQGYANTYL